MKMWHICAFELRRILKIRTVLLNLFILPLLLIFILGTALSGTMGSGEDAVIEPVRVGIIHSTEATEASVVDQALQTFVTSPAVSDMLKVSDLTSEEDAISALRQGELDFAVILPSGLQDQLVAGKGVELQWILGKDNTLNVVGQTVFTRFTDELNRQVAIAKVLGPEVIAAMASVPDTDLTEHTYITTSSPGKAGNSYSASQYYAASMLAMFMLYSGMTTINSLFSEKDKRTLIRLQAAPIGNSIIFAGKIAGNSLLAFMQAIIIIVMTYWLYGVNWGSHPWLIILICVLITIASMTIGIIVALVNKNATSASGMMQAIIIAMTFISGGFTPIAVDWVHRISEFTVNHWALQSFLRMMLDSSVSEIMHNIIMLGVVCAVLLLAAGVIYRKVGYRYE